MDRQEFLDTANFVVELLTFLNPTSIEGGEVFERFVCIFEDRNSKIHGLKRTEKEKLGKRILVLLNEDQKGLLKRLRIALLRNYTP